MTKREAKIAVWAALGPLILAVTALVNAYASHIQAETQKMEKLELSDSFQEYIEYVMEQRGCEP